MGWLKRAAPAGLATTAPQPGFPPRHDGHRLYFKHIQDVFTAKAGLPSGRVLRPPQGTRAAFAERAPAGGEGRARSGRRQEGRGQDGTRHRGSETGRGGPGPAGSGGRGAGRAGGRGAAKREAGGGRGRPPVPRPPARGARPPLPAALLPVPPPPFCPSACAPASGGRSLSLSRARSRRRSPLRARAVPKGGPVDGQLSPEGQREAHRTITYCRRTVSPHFSF